LPAEPPDATADMPQPGGGEPLVEEVQESRGRVIAEVLILFLATCVLIRGFLFLRDLIPQEWIRANVQIVVPLLFIGVPILIGRWNRRPIDPDIVLPEPLWRKLLQALRDVGLVILVIYPFFIVGNHLYLSWLLPEFTTWIGMNPPVRPHLPGHGLPPDLFEIIVWQLIAVGYAEEYFYRGYMQTRLQQVFRASRWRFLGVDIGAPFWITAVLFTAGHSLVHFEWWQPAIFFPALVFGWLRNKTGNILAGALFHAFANVAMITLDAIYGVRPA